MDWKTTTSRYLEGPTDLLSLDPQMLCYSWITGISELAMVVFVRKLLLAIQYLKTSISEEKRLEYGQLVEATIGHIEAAQFSSHSGILSPQNDCVSRAHRGLCLDDQRLMNSRLIRTLGAIDLDWPWPACGLAED